MKSGSWASYQAALPPEARAGGEPDESFAAIDAKRPKRTAVTEHPDILIPDWLTAYVAEGVAEDMSWHNDACNSFWFMHKEAKLGFILWVQHKDPAQREVFVESPVGWRFHTSGLVYEGKGAMHETNGFAMLDEDGQDVWNTESENEAQRHIEKWLELVRCVLPVVERAKQEILADVASGLIPKTVRSFAELHGYVDANGYGGAFESYDGSEECTAVWNRVQGEVDAWLKTGGVN